MTSKSSDYIDWVAKKRWEAQDGRLQMTADWIPYPFSAQWMRGNLQKKNCFIRRSLNGSANSDQEDERKNEDAMSSPDTPRLFIDLLFVGCSRYTKDGKDVAASVYGVDDYALLSSRSGDYFAHARWQVISDCW